jgi:hypothetical protein
MIEITLSHSQLSTYRKCARAYQYHYLARRVPVRDSVSLAIGRVWDDASGVWWKDGIDAARTWLVSNAGSINPEDAAKLAAILVHYRPARDRYAFVSNQATVTVPIRNPETGRPMRGVVVKCKADTVLKRHSDGTLWVREGKSTSREIDGFGPYWQRLQVDSQASWYHLAFGAEGVIYDVIRKPQIKCCGKDVTAALRELCTRAIEANGWAGEKCWNRKKPETLQEMLKKRGVEIRLPQDKVVDAYQQRVAEEVAEKPSKYLQWRELPKTERDLEEAARDLYQQARMIRESYRHGWWPRNSSSCESVYGSCEYMDVCCGRASINDDGQFMAPRWARRRPLPLAA